jgi:hypothetical protein
MQIFFLDSKKLKRSDPMTGDGAFRSFMVLNFVPSYGSFYGTKFHFSVAEVDLKRRGYSLLQKGERREGLCNTHRKR